MLISIIIISHTFSRNVCWCAFALFSNFFFFLFLSFFVSFSLSNDEFACADGCFFYLPERVRSLSSLSLSVLPSSKTNSTSSSSEISSLNSLSCQSTEGRKEKDRQQSKIGIVSHRCIMSNREGKGRINMVIVIFSSPRRAYIHHLDGHDRSVKNVHG